MFVFIERLIQLLVIFSILRSVLRFLGGLRRGMNRQTPPQARNAAPPGTRETATMLQPDPVCGTYVSVETSLKKIVDGKVYHFCSPACRDKFKV
jgi:YHS domain-containing protein